jgi:hypothetical protein
MVGLCHNKNIGFIMAAGLYHGQKQGRPMEARVLVLNFAASADVTKTKLCCNIFFKWNKLAREIYAYAGNESISTSKKTCPLRQGAHS